MQQAEIALSLVIIFYFCNEIPSPPTKGAFITQYIWGQPSVLCGASNIDTTSHRPHSCLSRMFSVLRALTHPQPAWHMAVMCPGQACQCCHLLGATQGVCLQPGTRDPAPSTRQILQEHPGSPDLFSCPSCSTSGRGQSSWSICILCSYRPSVGLAKYIYNTDRIQTSTIQTGEDF